VYEVLSSSAAYIRSALRAGTTLDAAELASIANNVEAMGEAILKHRNPPAGVLSDDDLSDAIARALEPVLPVAMGTLGMTIHTMTFNALRGRVQAPAAPHTCVACGHTDRVDFTPIDR